MKRFKMFSVDELMLIRSGLELDNQRYWNDSTKQFECPKNREEAFMLFMSMMEEIEEHLKIKLTQV